jgi:hypothetical protein
LRLDSMLVRDLLFLLPFVFLFYPKNIFKSWSQFGSQLGPTFLWSLYSYLTPHLAVYLSFFLSIYLSSIIYQSFIAELELELKTCRISALPLN